MGGYIIKRIFSIIPVFFALTFFTFGMMKLSPGGPFDADRRVPPEVEKSLREKYNLDKPFHQQYYLYLKGIFHGDLGPSFYYPDRTVIDVIKEGFPITFWIGVKAIILALILGLALGFISVLMVGGILDSVALSLSMLWIVIPNFVLAPALIYILGMKYELVSVVWTGAMIDSILPVVVLALPFAGRIAVLFRTELLNGLKEKFVLTVRAKGLSKRQIIYSHCIKLAMIPVISFLGPAAAGILTGSVVVEKIFAIPGIGNEFVISAFNRDYTVVLGLVLVYSGLLVTFNILTDIAYTLLDPRINLSKISSKM